MKKTIGILLVLGVVAVGVYLYKGNQTSGGSAMLAYVPADTVMFAGGFDSASYEQQMALTRAMLPNIDQLTGLLDKSFQDIQKDAPDGGKFFLHFLSRLLKASSGNGLQELGLDRSGSSVFYAAGVYPVMRLALQDGNLWNAYLDAAEKDLNLSPKTGSVDGVDYREYLIDKKSNGEDEVGLLVAVQDQQVVMALNTPMADDVDLKPVFSKPQQSLGNTAVLSDLSNKYGYQDYSLFFLNIEAFVNGLTDPDANSFGQSLQQILEREGQSDALADMRTEPCKKEFNALAAKWPRISFGTIETSSTSVSYKGMFEGTDTELLTKLQRIQGHLTPMVSDRGMLVGLGMGLNMNELAPVLGEIWSDMASQPFQCEALAGADFQQANPAMALGMVSGMLNGVRGVGVGVVDMDIDAISGGNPDPLAAMNTLNMIVTISATDPKLLLQSLASLQPGMAGINPEDGGELIDLPMPMPVPVKLGLRGHDLVLSMGDKANAMASELSPNKEMPINGLFAFSMDIGKYFELIPMALEQQPVPEQSRALLEMFKGMKGHYSEKYQLTDQGFEITGQVSVGESQ